MRTPELNGEKMTLCDSIAILLAREKNKKGIDFIPFR